MKKTLFAIAAAMLLLTGCSGSKNSEGSSSVPVTTETISTSVTETQTETQTQTQPATEEQPATTTRAHVDPPASFAYKTNGDEGELTDKEIIDLLMQTYYAGINRDFKVYDSTSDVNIAHYLSKGVFADGDEELSYISNDAEMTVYFLMYDYYAEIHPYFVDPERVSSQELDKINAFFKKLCENKELEFDPPVDKLLFEDAYKAYLRYDDQPEEYMNARIYVVKIGGEWKSEVYITFLMDMYGGFDE